MNDVNITTKIVKASPGGMYWQDPEAFTSTFVWNVASNLSSALQGEKDVGYYRNSMGTFQRKILKAA